MRSFRICLWMVTIGGGIALYWWFQYGSWQLHGNTLLEHDEVRFGRYPTALSALWLLSGFLLIRSYFRRPASANRESNVATTLPTEKVMGENLVESEELKRQYRDGRERLSKILDQPAGEIDTECDHGYHGHHDDGLGSHADHAGDGDGE